MTSLRATMGVRPKGGVREWRRRLGIVGFKAYDRVEEEYVDDVVRLSAIAKHVHDSDRGSFLKAMADAWLLADSSDQRILRQAWASIVTKYNLVEPSP